MSKNKSYQVTSILLSGLLLIPLPITLAGCSGQLSEQVKEAGTLGAGQINPETVIGGN